MGLAAVFGVMSDPDRVRAHVLVSGRVQGVYYRASTRDAARERGADGWAQNLADGRVEAVFEADTEAVDAMCEWCETGSRAAEVDSVDVTMETPEGIDGFEVRW